MKKNRIIGLVFGLSFLFTSVCHAAIPHTFSAETGPIPLSWLDDNFTYVLSNVTAGGSTTQVQYNNAGVFGGNAGFTYDATNYAITVGKTSTASSFTGSVFQYGSSFTASLSGSRTFPESTKASVNILRNSNAASGGSYGLEVAVQNATTSPQELIGVYAGVENYGNTGGLGGFGGFFMLATHGTAPAYGIAVDVADYGGGADFIKGFHTGLFAMAATSAATYGLDIQAADQNIKGSPFTAAIAIGRSGTGTNWGWGTGLWGDSTSGTFVTDFIALSPSLSTAGVPSSPIFAVDKNGKILLNTLVDTISILPINGSAPVWIAPTLAGNWVNVGSGYSTAGYFRDALGIVHLRGLIHCSAACNSSTVTTLPAGYRPSLSFAFVASTANGYSCTLSVLSTGVVAGTGLTNGDCRAPEWLSLDGITFPTF